MADFYPDIAAEALDLITEFGVDVVLQRRTLTHTPGSDAVPGTATTETVKGVFTSIAPREIDGTNIIIGDKRLVIAASGMTTVPKAGDEVVYDGETWRITEPDPVKPAAIPIVYKLRIRR